METHKAKVVKEGDEYFIDINCGSEIIRIPLSDDQPNDVKSAFNKIILQLKKGMFSINLEDVQEDLFSQVANEYIKQLNREITEVYGEVEQHGLIDEQ